MRNPNMMIVILVPLLAAALAISALGQKPADRYIDAAHGFSITLPPAWGLRPDSNDTSTIFAPRSTVFTANLNFGTESKASTLQDYANGELAYVLAHPTEFGTDAFAVDSKGAFSTDAHVDGIRVILVSVVRGVKLRQTQYYFAAGDKKFVLTFSALDADKATNDALFDASAKTFTIGK